MYKSLVKPFFDFLCSSIVLVLVSPVFLFLIIFLALANKGNVFFTQKRPGKNARIFHVIKFKTMNDKRDEFGVLLPDSERITTIGSFVRKTSLDEIPQLLNVLKGDMSIVGPRPLLVEYLPLYNEEQKKRHDVKPGITGWAQVNGRNAISWQSKFELDVWYIKNQSLIVDLKILFLTIKKVIKSEDINSDTTATMEKFYGNP